MKPRVLPTSWAATSRGPVPCPPLGHQGRRGFGAVDLGRLGQVATVGQVDGRRGQSGPLLVGGTVDLRQDTHREGHRVLGDDARPALGTEVVDQFVGQSLGVLPDLEEVDRLQRVADHRGPYAVPLTCRVQDGRLPTADQRGQRPVLGDAVPLVPEFGVAGEEHGGRR